MLPWAIASVVAIIACYACFFFGRDFEARKVRPNQLTIRTKMGQRGRWRFTFVDKKGKGRAFGPMHGYESKIEAIGAAENVQALMRGERTA